MKTDTRALAILVTTALLAGCGDGADGVNGTPGADGTSGLTSLIASIAEPAGANCLYGGNRVTSGPDRNASGVLDSDEVTATGYVCNGSPSADTLVASAVEPAGANCPAGGNKLTSGPDTNGNVVLDVSEVVSTSYVCNGGNGMNTLIAIAAEPAGAHCADGGNKITSGVDVNASTVLDAAEISATSYLCNGSAGPGVTWVHVTGTSQQAVSNKGYLADSVDQVTITLPAAPAIGDLVQVSGMGAGGWKIAQNAGQSIATGSLDGGAIGITWTQRNLPTGGQAVASSADGTRLAVSRQPGYIYTSADSGETWTQRDAIRTWSAIASSADGTHLVAANRGGELFTSADSGVSWTAHGPTQLWSSVASSADGTKLIAVATSGQIYTSSDSGLNWAARESIRVWSAVASSGDGERLVAAESGGLLYTSTDSGVTWIPRDSSRYWTSVASSADGTRLAAAADNSDQIYVSGDSGITWTPRAPVGPWSEVASSADGTRLVGVFVGALYTSAPVPMSATTTGTAGFLSGRRLDAIDLQYLGSGSFFVRSSAGVFDIQ